MYTSCIPCPMMSLILIHSLRERRAAPKAGEHEKPESTKKPDGTVKPENTPEPEASGTQEPENTPDIPRRRFRGGNRSAGGAGDFRGRVEGCSFLGRLKMKAVKGHAWNKNITYFRRQIK